MSSEVITRNDLTAILNEVLPSQSLADLFYPVGSYYETSNTSFDPNIVWGGTWVEDTQGRVLVGAGTNDSVTYTTGDTGGNKDAIVPYHRHTFTQYAAGGFNHPASGTLNTLYYAAAGTATINTSYAGTSGNTTNANMQPYTVIKRWHRIA